MLEAAIQRKSPAFSAAAVLHAALGIGANTAINTRQDAAYSPYCLVAYLPAGNPNA